ncbi:MAG: UDP-N-acetylmuramoyl-L-alanine--D-glutamate ligase [Thermoanaerobacterales bacterium]|nr:UDP-N-acetylmuramoyl-L-alanine--D-glutamate ligase [Thermoanaerobacterales bacterium]
MQLEGRRVLVVGAGKSGLAAANLLARKGARATLSDAKGADELGGRLSGLDDRVTLALGSYPDVTREAWDLVVVSPGVPANIPLLAQAYAAGVEVIGEMELAWRFARAPMVAVTGTNGKTTTTALVGEIFRTAGRRTLVAGNIGTPLSAAVEDFGPEDVIVLEVSSFQLEAAPTVRPHVALILNITPDHLDRHGNMTAYTAAKARIFANQGPDDWTILNADDPPTAALAASSPGRVIFFSRRHRLELGVFVHQGRIVVNGGGPEGPQTVCPVNALRIPGAHNLENALAAVGAAWAMDVPVETVARALQAFQGVPHRLELVGVVSGVRFINDSKGTNPDASIKALEAFTDPIVLIAGGRNKGNDFRPFAARFRDKVRALVVLGEAADEIARAAAEAGLREIRSAPDLPSAVRAAAELARPGDIVLLSPACASWDMFRNYEERGDLFRRAVTEMAEGS